MDTTEALELVKKYWYVPVGAGALYLLSRSRSASASDTGPLVPQDTPALASAPLAGSSAAPASASASDQQAAALAAQGAQFDFWFSPQLPGSFAPDTATDTIGRTPKPSGPQSRYQLYNQQVLQPQADAQAAQQAQIYARQDQQYQQQQQAQQEQQKAAERASNPFSSWGNFFKTAASIAVAASGRSAPQPMAAAPPRQTPVGAISSPGYSDLLRGGIAA